MKLNHIRAFVLTGALAALAVGSGCVADRPSRNGVFNENQYLRKDFLIRPGDGSQPDPGWMSKVTVVATSVPNPLALNGFVVGSENGGQYVRWVVSQDKLQMVNMREISGDTTVNSGDPANSTGSIGAQGTRIPEVLNAWPATNVDLKYRVNLDGEKTNFYEENQELDWQSRQWVKVNFDKNDLSDIAPFGAFANDFIQKCTDWTEASTTLVPNSFAVDDTNGYFSFTVRVTLPITYSAQPQISVDQTTGVATTTVDNFCSDAFGKPGLDFNRMGRNSVTLDLMYSFARAVPDSAITYKPLVIDEHDPIRRKYGTIDIATPSMDPATGLLTTRALSFRFDPAKPITYYFAPGYPEVYKTFFTKPGGIVDQTNAIFTKAGAAARLSVLNYNDDTTLGDAAGPVRQVGDVRYSFIRWISDIEVGASFLAVTQFVPDPRTGEIISDSINVVDFSWRDVVLAKLDYFEQSIGAVNWSTPPSGCQDGDTIPLVPATVASNHNGNSTLFTKMQAYLQKPVQQYGKLGPQDFIVQQDADFFKAFFTIVPYEVFSDPATNPYVVWEGGNGTTAAAASVQMAALAGEAQFHKFMSQIDQGWIPYNVDTGPGGVQDVKAFLGQLKSAVIAHRDNDYLKNFRTPYRFADDTSMYSLETLFQRDSRHCINGQWETRDQYVNSLAMTYYAGTVWHEFGHALGLDHNFMASVDRPNFPHYKDKSGRDHVGGYQSSIMEYNATPDRIFWSNSDATSEGQAGWYPYDKAAIGFIYANPGVAQISAVTAANTANKIGNSVSGQSGTAVDGSGATVAQATARWKDPYGFADPNTETQFLFCNANHLKYSPFCKQFDFGTTPSEIIASEIDSYEWNYLWRNFRQYHKYFDFSAYADAPTTFFTDMRKFLSTWEYDWSQGELSDTLRKLGLTPPAGSPSGQYYDQLTNKFQADISAANQMVAAAYQAIVQQASGERPYKTTYDAYYGDTTQQGIIADKLIAIQGFTDLWATDNYDPTQAQGAFFSSYSLGDAGYSYVAENAIKSMIGGGYDIFPYATPAGVLSFSTAAHSTYFATSSRPEIRDWIGGYTFTRLQDFLDFFRNIADTNNFADVYDPVTGQPTHYCTSIADCSYDPRTKSVPGQANYRFQSDVYNQFLGPDYRRWIWTYIQDRNVWVVSDHDRNAATFVIQFNYNSVVYASEEDGSGESGYSAYQQQLPLKYFYDDFATYN